MPKDREYTLWAPEYASYQHESPKFVIEPDTFQDGRAILWPRKDAGKLDVADEWYIDFKDAFLSQRDLQQPFVVKDDPRLSYETDVEHLRGHYRTYCYRQSRWMKHALSQFHDDAVGEHVFAEFLSESEAIACVTNVGVRDRRLEAVVALERMQIGENQLDAACAALLGFVTDFASATDEKTIIAVAAAVRKFVAVAPDAFIDDLERFFSPESTPFVDERLMVDAVKALCLRFTWNPTGTITDRLTDGVYEIAISGLHLYSLRKPRVASVALNAIVATWLMGRRVDQLAEAVKSLNIEWFQMMVRGRVNEVLRQVASTAGEDAEVLAVLRKDATKLCRS